LRCVGFHLPGLDCSVELSHIGGPVVQVVQIGHDVLDPKDHVELHLLNDLTRLGHKGALLAHEVIAI
jgi:hypothetical protein